MWHRSKEHIQDILKYCTTLLTNEDNFDFISVFFLLVQMHVKEYLAKEESSL